MHSDYLLQSENICWIKADSLAILWRSLGQGLVWAYAHIHPNTSSLRSHYVHNASLACLLSVHCSGWFSRPNDNHKGWRDAFRLLTAGRRKESPYLLLDKIITLDAFGFLQTQQSLSESALMHMLGKHFRPMDYKNVNRREHTTALIRSALLRRRIVVDVPIPKPSPIDPSVSNM